MSWPPPANNRRGPARGKVLHHATRLKLDGRTVYLIPRAASQSMKQALIPAGAVPVDEAVGRSIMWIREPFDRLATASAIFNGAYENYEQWIDTILSGEFNIHWWPQTALYDDMPAVLYPFDTLNDTWKEEFPDIPLPWKNQSHRPERGMPRVPWYDIEPWLRTDQIEALQVYYEKDIAAYHDACTPR